MYHGNIEPTISELLGDPIARLILACDGLRTEMVWDCMHDAKRRLRTVPSIGTHFQRRQRIGLSDRHCVAVARAAR